MPFNGPYGGALPTEKTMTDVKCVILDLLAAYDAREGKGPILQAGLVDLLPPWVSASTISRALGALERDGLVRTVSQFGKPTEVYLTDKGRGIRPAVVAYLVAKVQVGGGAQSGDIYASRITHF